MPRLLPLFVLLAGCSGAPVYVGPSDGAPAPTSPVRFVANAEGKGDVQVIPFTNLLTWEGRVKLIAQPVPPYLIVEEDFSHEGDLEPVEALVEPSEGNEAAALDAVERGDVVILRKGKPSQLDAPGSIAARKARRFPPAEKPKPEPVSGIVPLQDCPGGCCALPDPIFPVEVASCAR